MWVIGPRAGVKQCVPKKGYSWVLAIKWGPGSQKGIRGSEFLFSAPDLSLPRAQDQRAGPPPGEEREGPQSQGQGPSTGLGWGSRPLSRLRPGPGLAGPRYSRVPAGLMGEAAPELSLPPAASFSFLPLYWPMKEPSSLNCTSTLPP